MATQAEVADHLDLSRQAVGDLVRRGIFESKGPRGLDIDDCRVRYVRHLRAMAAGWKGEDEDGEVLDLTAERARKAKEEADRLEMQNAQMRRELLPRADVDAAVIEDYSRVRARLLNVPSKVAPLVAAATEPREAEGLVKRAIYEALQELSDPEALFDTGAGMADGIEASADADRERVGRSREEA